VTQRDPPPLPVLNDDEDEERTAVGVAPRHDSSPDGIPSPLGSAPGLSRQNTPTAFTPLGAPIGSARNVPAAPPSAPASERERSGPPRSQQMPRPTTQVGLGSVVGGHGAPSQHGQSAQTQAPPSLSGGASGPQPVSNLAAMPMGMGPPPGPGPFGSVTPGHGNTIPGPGPGPSGFTGGSVGTAAMNSSAMVAAGSTSLAVRADGPRDVRTNAFHVTRSRAYSFVLDARGQPIELGSGRFAKVFLGEERWLESKTDFRRQVVIKILQKGVSEEDHLRFQMEKELLERVQGHPNIVELFASGENEDLSFLPPSVRDKCETEFMILERLEMSLEERLKGSRNRASKEDLLACDMRERLFRVLDYMIPIASAVEYAHLVRNICHRDIKPANVLVGLPDTTLRGSTLQVRLADFNVAKLSDIEVNMGMTRMQAAVPGTLFFQSPEQETNILELLVNVQQGLPEVEYFEDFYIQIAKNDSFSLFNRGEQYPILYADRVRKRLVLARPFKETSETNVRARIQKSVGRPADIYSLGATFYYLISGAYANPKTLYDAFHKFIEYERADENNTIESYLRHEYSVINSLRAPKTQDGTPEVAPADRFFSYKHYLDGNGELIDPNIMLIIAKCMIRNKPDSYCQAHDLETKGISDLVADLINLYSLYGFQAGARPTYLAQRTTARRGLFKARVGNQLRGAWLNFLGLFRRRKG
jgi:serine/threonine protein kinase